jgi:hypothetical protein
MSGLFGCSMKEDHGWCALSPHIPASLLRAERSASLDVSATALRAHKVTVLRHVNEDQSFHSFHFSNVFTA